MLQSKEEAQVNLPSFCIFTIDSLHSLAAMNVIIPQCSSNIIKIYISNLYRKKKGNFFKQLYLNLRKSGVRYVVYLSQNFLLYNFVLFFLNFFRLVRGKSILRSTRGLARYYHIPILKINNINSKEVELEINTLKPDLVVSCIFDQILKSNVYSIPQYGTINVHTGILPSYKGPFPTIFEAINHETQIGGSIHFVNSGIDAGKIIEVFYQPINSKDSILIQEYKLMKSAGEHLVQLLYKFKKGGFKAHDNLGGSYYGYPTRRDVRQLQKAGYHLVKLLDLFRLYD